MDIAVLISSIGRRGQLVDCFRESARDLGRKIRIVGADSRPQLSAACHLADMSIAVPPCRDPEYVSVLLEVCKAHGIRLLVPTIDTELQVLSECRDVFARIGVTVAVSAPSVVKVARDKGKTSTLLAELGVNTPRTVAASAYRHDPSLLRSPVILKPRTGSSSIGIFRPTNRAEVDAAFAAGSDMIAQELWEGSEYTVNLFFDAAGALRCAVPHRRIETRAGEVSKGRTEDVLVLRNAARSIASGLSGARGALCFQAIVTDAGDYAVFEINARFGGGYPLAHRAGARFTTWLLEEALGLPSTASDIWTPGITIPLSSTLTTLCTWNGTMYSVLLRRSVIGLRPNTARRVSWNVHNVCLTPACEDEYSTKRYRRLG